MALTHWDGDRDTGRAAGWRESTVLALLPAARRPARDPGRKAHPAEAPGDGEASLNPPAVIGSGRRGPPCPIRVTAGAPWTLGAEAFSLSLSLSPLSAEASRPPREAGEETWRSRGLGSVSVPPDETHWEARLTLILCSASQKLPQGSSLFELGFC